MENPLKEGEQKVEAAIKSEPWYIWAGAATAAGVMVYFIWKRKRQAASAVTNSDTPTDASNGGTTAADGAQLNGFQVDSMAGIPFGEQASGYNYQAGPVDNYPSGLAEVGVNGSNYPIIPYGDTPIYDSNGNLVGFQSANPTPTTSPAPAPTPAPTPTPTPATYVTTKGGASLETTPHDTNGGKNILSLPLGALLTFVGGPVPDPAKGSKKQYYLVSYQGKTGYVGSDAIMKSATGGGSIPNYMGDGGDNGFHVAVNQGRNTVDQWTFSNGMHQDFDSFAHVGE